jgi:TRAP-type C4-dicarboxylate transport system permease small subunit
MPVGNWQRALKILVVALMIGAMIALASWSVNGARERGNDDAACLDYGTHC